MNGAPAARVSRSTGDSPRVTFGSGEPSHDDQLPMSVRAAASASSHSGRG